ncbi:hypothetical protein [Paenibacillus sp. UASWS1643]|nr:hypothetical protein [Paenibacillus sp. UASWS1643]
MCSLIVSELLRNKDFHVMLAFMEGLGPEDAEHPSSDPEIRAFSL